MEGTEIQHCLIYVYVICILIYVYVSSYMYMRMRIIVRMMYTGGRVRMSVVNSVNDTAITNIKRAPITNN